MTMPHRMPGRDRTTAAVSLERRRASHAEALFAVLAEPLLYAHIEEAPPASVDALRERLRRSEGGKSPDGTEHWLNWVVREGGPSGAVAGYVQATVRADGEAWIAYMLGRDFQGRGLASAAVAQMLAILASDFDVTKVLLVAERANAKSVRLAERLGFVEASPQLALRKRIAETDVLMQRAASLSLVG